MISSALVQRVDTTSLPVLAIEAWRDTLSQSLGAGARLVTLYGRRVGDEVSLSAVLEERDDSVRLLRALVPVHVGYHALTAEFPALHCFERELHEQTGLRLPGHPWLKPLRYEGPEAPAMRDYPFYELEGKEVHQVAVGPIHASIIEPCAFRFMCLGEQVHHLEIQLGYQHRGVERRLLEGDPRGHAQLVETIAGDTSIAHGWAYCAALEALADCAPQLLVDAARGVALELERVALHLATLSGLAMDLGFSQVAATYGRIRTLVINTLLELCGSRFGRGAMRPGGVAMTCPAGLHQRMDTWQRDVALAHASFLGARSVQHRLRGTGLLRQEHARALGSVGVVARASGVALDARTRAQGIYSVLPLAAAIEADGDCWARAHVRITEMTESLTWLSTMLALFPDWRAREPRSITALAPSQWVITRVEGARGEVVHCLETDRSGALLHYKVQDPSLRNWLGVAIAMRGNEISDFPICNKSFDLSYCGHDL
jgi:Ni,Fe-hydrogenase III large subunit